MRIDVDGATAEFQMRPRAAEAFLALSRMIESDPMWTDIRHVGYFLATIWHETAHTFLPIYERGQRSYFNKYEPGTSIGKRLGNIRLGDGYKYRGRGFVQITGRANYAKMGNILQLDLVNNPDLALDSVVAYRIAALGMRAGSFTTRALEDYFNAKKSDWVNARRIINHIDKAEMIAAYGLRFVKYISA